MTGLNHTLTGAAIALAIRRPELVVPLAFTSHFLLDSLPHFDHPHYQYGSNYFTKIMLADGIISVGAIAAILLLAPQLAVVVILGSLIAILPDFFWLYYYMHGRPQWWFFRFHTKIQWFERPQGALVEAAYLVFITTAIFAIKSKGIL